jgi:hypothetical protein
VIEKEIYWKLRHVDFKLGEDNPPRFFRGIHFGILIEEKLYYWSFMKQAFFDAEAHYYNSSTLRSLKHQKLVLQKGQLLKPKAENVTDKQIHISSYHAQSGSEQGDEGLQPQPYQQMAAIQSAYKGWLDTIKKRHPLLTPDDFICPHI